jgi:hypothetical protein
MAPIAINHVEYVATTNGVTRRRRLSCVRTQVAPQRPQGRQRRLISFTSLNKQNPDRFLPKRSLVNIVVASGRRSIDRRSNATKFKYSIISFFSDSQLEPPHPGRATTVSAIHHGLAACAKFGPHRERDVVTRRFARVLVIEGKTARWTVP